MEITKNEVRAVAHTVESATDLALKDLSELELMLVGGGQGEVVIA